MPEVLPSVFLSDPDVTLWHGDVLETLRELPAESVDCVVTSPPYWGLRDYGTGGWQGGDPEHAHETVTARAGRGGSGSPGKQTEGAFPSEYAASKCSCGATRIDQQLGLEPTPEQYVERMVEVFREVRRVLAAHGTVWLNLGDSYVSTAPGTKNAPAVITGSGAEARAQMRPAIPTGLKSKDLVGIPWRIAFALQADGWWLRSAITWCKPNCMPESVTDRPTKATEMVFLLTKAPRYYYDAEAIREKDSGLASGNGFDGRMGGARQTAVDGGHGSPERFVPGSGRNMRDWWEIPTQPYPMAHFATFPEELARRAIAAGCPEQVCGVCGKARERVVERTAYEPEVVEAGVRFVDESRGDKTRKLSGAAYNASVRVIGETWSDCGHSDYRCGDCGMVINSSDYAGSKVTVPELHGDPRSDREAGSSEALLLAGVRERVDGETPQDDEGLLHRREGLSPDPQAGSSAGVQERLHHGASAGDRARTGATAATGRDRASQGREQGEQPGEEPGSDAEADSRPQAETTTEADHLPSLRGNDHRLGPCPSCDGRLERVPDHERFRPGVTLDPFMGSGTVAFVARKLGRHSIGIDLNAEYLELAARRLQQQSLFSEVAS